MNLPHRVESAFGSSDWIIVGFELKDARRKDRKHQSVHYADNPDRCITVGRQGDCVAGNEPGSAVGRYHARIIWADDGRCRIEDTSLNGTIVQHDDGSFMQLAKGTGTVLFDGDELYLAGVVEGDPPAVAIDQRGALLEFTYLRQVELQ